MKESLPELKNRAREIIRRLKKAYPKSRCSLDHQNPFQLLVATILSAQCTDERVNQVTPRLFAKYPDAKALAEAPLEEIVEIIRPTGFFNNKAKNIKACAQALVERHGGEVPPDLDAMVKLPGVGRKTANVVLGTGFGIPGIVVDTHVTRLTNLLGLTKNRDAVKIEHDLEKILDQEDWVIFAHLFIDHGRAVCKARRPQCYQCVLNDLCPSAQVQTQE